MGNASQERLHRRGQLDLRTATRSAARFRPNPETRPEITVQRLLDLEGIARIEQGLNLKNALWAPENDDMPQRLVALSVKHFGRTVEQTWFEYPERFWELYDENDPYDDDDDAVISDDRQWLYDQMNAAGDWALHFEVLDLPFAQQIPLWTALGWDVTNEKGERPKCMEHFERALLAHAKGLPLQGDDAIPEPDAENWGAKLAAEAKKFNSNSRR